MVKRKEEGIVKACMRERARKSTWKFRDNFVVDKINFGTRIIHTHTISEKNNIER